MTAHPPPFDRRRFLHHGARLAVSATAIASLASARAAQGPPADTTASRALNLAHNHTGERIALVFAQGQRYLPDALQALNHFLRDHYTGEVGCIDPRLFDMMHRVQQTLGSGTAYEVISGYRCSATNERLRRQGGGGVARRSLHMDGQAIDVRLRGVALSELHAAARGLAAGGVGYYQRDRFVHLDTGRPRHW